MDLFVQAFLNPLLNIFISNWWIIALIILILYMHRYIPQIRGLIGEARVKEALSVLPEDVYTIMHDVLLETQTGTSQIDHVVVSIYGIFVIETKNYSGAIYGKYRDKRWTTAQGDSRRSFMNPIHQNYGHLKAIERALDGEFPLKFIPIVVFSDGCKLCLTLEDDAVVHIRELISEIRRHTETLLTFEQSEGIAKMLRARNLPGRAARREHIKRVSANKT